MKTIATLTVTQLNALARIAMLDLNRQVIFLADSPVDVFKEQFKDSMDPYMLRILLKVLPDLNTGTTPVITDNDEPGLMLVKATYCGIRAYGLHAFFAAAEHPFGFGGFKIKYLTDSIHQGDFDPYERYCVQQALKTYASVLEDIYARESARRLVAPKSDLLKIQTHHIGDYWDNVMAARHIGKDMSAWGVHAKKNNAGARV